jgi:2-C-methyl-D-erythritol 4-phosphate cytidylyltransferase
VRIAAILLAAGPGTRLEAGEPKAFASVAGVPLLIRSLGSLEAAESIASVVVVVPAGEQARAEKLTAAHGPWRTAVTTVEGGAERQDSVRAGLAATDPDAEWIAIHDAARPFVSPALIAEVAAAARLYGAAVPALPATDTPKLLRDDGSVESTLARSRVWLAQTPQIFAADLIRRAHARAAPGESATDDAMLVERIGARVQVVSGEAANRKITTPEDLRWAEWWIARRGRSPR